MWQSFELRERVGELTGLPTVLGPAGQGRVLAERWKGAAADVTDVMVLLMSDAVEAGIISNDRLLHGRLGNAGQLGHVVVEPDGLACVCGGAGCLTSYVSSSAIEAETNRPLRRAPASVDRASRRDDRARRGVGGGRVRPQPRRARRFGPRGVRPDARSTRRVASSTSAAAWPTCAAAPTAASTVSASSSASLGREAPLVGAAALARWSSVAA